MTQNADAGNPGAQPNSPNAPTGSLIEQLVGPDKKFSDLEALARGKLESDNFIPKLTNENKELRSNLEKTQRELEAMRTKVSILDRLNGTDDAASRGGDSNQNQPQNQNRQTEESVTGLTAEEVLGLMEARDVDKARRTNLATVETTLRKQFGSDAVAAVRQKAAELGLAVDDLMQIGARSPDALFRMIGTNEASTGNQSLYPGNGQQVAKNPNGSIRNLAYYENLRKTMGSAKFILDRNLQLQMHKDMQALGDTWDS